MFGKNFFEKINTSRTNDSKPKENSVLEQIRKLNSKNLILTMALVSGLNSVSKAEEAINPALSKGFRSEVIDHKDKIEFQAVNYFASDSDFISKEAEDQIGYDFQRLLDQVNEENYKQIIEDGIYVYSSADPERTNNFKDNETLAKARAQSLIELLKKQLENIKFSYLSKEHAEEFVNDVKFFIEVPTSEKVSNPQVGVIYPEDLGYSKESLKGMSRSEIDKIYAECRKVVVSLGVYKNDTYYVKADDFIKPVSPKDIQELKNENIQNKVNWNADNIVILVDNSPSVGENSYKEVLGKIMNDPDLIGKKIQFSFFSKSLGETILCESVKEVIDVINKEKFAGDKTEQALSSSLYKIRSIQIDKDKKESTVMKTFTDENLQNISLQMINSFKEETTDKNIDANFYFVDKSNGLMQINVNELKEAIERQFLEDMKGVIRNYISNKSREIRNINKNQKDIIQKQLNDLSLAYEKGDLDGVLDNPLLNEVYGYRNAKNVLIKKNIPVVSLKNLGHRASTSDGNLVYNQNL